MTEESTTSGLVALVRRQVDAVSRHDVDAMLSFWGPDSIWDMSPLGLGVYKGEAAIRRFFQDWWGAYDEYGLEAEEILDLGNGVTFAVFIQRARPVGSSGEVRLRYAGVGVWANGVILRGTNYTDIDEARAAAERLAEERGAGGVAG